MPLKKSARSKTSAAAKKSPSSAAAAPPEQATPAHLDAAMDSSRMMGAGAVLLVFCVMAAAMLLAARESGSPSSAARTDSPAEIAAPVDVDAKSPVAARPPMARVSTSTPAAAAKSTVTSPFVTITGCLERGGDSFRLTHTDGSDAPRSRSWKSGFLKKGPAAVEIVDQTNRVKLSSHVGQRVSVTGPLEERQMQVRSLRRIAPACE